MDSVSEHKEALLTVYPNQTWRQKVSKMSASQITAIYLNLKKQGKV